MNSKLKAYQNTDTLALSQLDLVIKVYDGAITSFTDAAESYKGNKSEKAYEQLEKAKRFVTHLYT